MKFADVGSEEMVLGEGFVTAFLCACKWFGTVMPILVRLEMLRRPETFLAVLRVACERSRGLRKVAPSVRLEVGVSKIRFVASLANEGSLQNNQFAISISGFF